MIKKMDSPNPFLFFIFLYFFIYFYFCGVPPIITTPPEESYDHARLVFGKGKYPTTGRDRCDYRK